MTHDGILARAYDSVHGEGAFAKALDAAMGRAIDQATFHVPAAVEPEPRSPLEMIDAALANLAAERKVIVVHPDLEERAKEVVARYAAAPRLWRVVANAHLDRNAAMVMRESDDLPPLRFDT